jgi:hypothetical protein
MKRTIFALLMGLLAVANAAAQQPSTKGATRGDAPGTQPVQPRPVAPVEPVLNRRISTGELQPTTQMWFYEQELQRYNDPKLAVRRKAEFRAAQRESRLAALAWFGLSNSRPVASPTPVMGTYSPSWSSNYIDPYRWMGVRTAPYTPHYSSSTGFYGMW